jgi:hypothetical protein
LKVEKFEGWKVGQLIFSAPAAGINLIIFNNEKHFMKTIAILFLSFFLIMLSSCRGRYDNGYRQEFQCKFFSKSELEKYPLTKAGNTRDYFIKLMTSDSTIKSVSSFLMNIDSCFTPEFIRKSIVVVPDHNLGNQTNIYLYIFNMDFKKASFIGREMEVETETIDKNYLRETFEPQLRKYSDHVCDSLRTVLNTEKIKIENARHQKLPVDSSAYFNIKKLLKTDWMAIEQNRINKNGDISNRFISIAKPVFGYYPKNGIEDN